MLALSKSGCEREITGYGDGGHMQNLDELNGEEEVHGLEREGVGEGGVSGLEEVGKGVGI